MGQPPRYAGRLRQVSAAPIARLRTTITWLEMAAPPVEPAPPDPPGLRIERARGIDVSFYRFLYDTVGAAYLWYERRALHEPALAALLRDPAISVHVACEGDTPAGFFELDRRHPTDIDLAYFGLLPDFVGKGLGRWFLRRAVDAAWAEKPRLVSVNTNSFDHPRALANYRRAGFVPVRRLDHEFDDPRLTGLIP